jgi:antitoxin (DNA-binding transcriptional repressor) of toxin-antitoxin stability system
MPPVLALAAVTAGCAGDPGPHDAAAVFGSFQRALQRGDEDACRSLLTVQSAAALQQMPWERVARQQPLVVRGARREGSELRVEVADPNAGGRAGEFVVVREHGRLVVDLVASAGLTAQTVEAAGAADTVVPRELTPADLDRIRLHELAQPPR